MRQYPTSHSLPNSSLIPHSNTEIEEGKVYQQIVDSLRSSVLYLDNKGNIISANSMAKTLFNSECLEGRSFKRYLAYFDKPERCLSEVVMVVETGEAVLGSIVRANMNDQVYWFQTDIVPIKNQQNTHNNVLVTLDDITELKAKELIIEQSEARYEAFLTSSQDAIWRVDMLPPIPLIWTSKRIAEEIKNRSVFAYSNSVFPELFGFDGVGELLSNVIKKAGKGSEDFNEIFAADIQFFVENNFKSKLMDVALKNKSGVTINLQTTLSGIVKDGFLTQIWGVSRDITVRQNYVDQLEYQNTHDMLTGLPNRVLLERIAKSIMLGKRNSSVIEGSLALLIVDLDQFKDINDTLGHHVGDNIIKEIGSRIKPILSPLKGVIARLGGDEFAILIPSVENKNDLFGLAEKIILAIRKEFFINEMVIEVRASIGISMFPNQAHDFSTLLRYADVAMYVAKKTHSTFQLYNSEIDQHSPKRLLLMSELGKAIRLNNLSLYYQPKIAVDSLKVVGVEALARWNHPRMGMISPAEFIPIAEMTDMINEMTDWVLYESLKQLRIWKNQGINTKVAVNISARNLLNEDLLKRIEYLLHRYNLPPSCLELEITESTIMNNAEYSLSILEKISNLGIDLSIDDFGTGYSSLSYLKRLPVQWLKIDYAFIINMLNDDQDQIIVNSTIQMAQNLGLRVVAEGVETKELLEMLKKMGCEHAQGFHIAHPMPADDFKEWHLEHNNE